MKALPAETRQQILTLIAEGHGNSHIERTTGIHRCTIARYRAGHIPQPRNLADEPSCRHGHPYPENLRTDIDGRHYCRACAREQRRAWSERNPPGSRKPKPTLPPTPPRPTPSPLPGHGDWRHHAVCREEDPELFFPTGKTAPALLQTAEAKAVCYRCPALDHCAGWAIQSGQKHGVWGGYDEAERRSILRRRARAKQKQVAA